MILAEVLTLPKERVISDRNLIGHTQLDFFVVVEKLFSSTTGETIKYLKEDPLKEVLITPLRSTIQISAFGKNANLLIEKLRTILRSTYGQELVNDLKVGLLGVSDVRNISSNFGASYEERASIDIYLSHSNIVETSLTVMPYADLSVDNGKGINKFTVNNPKNKE